MKPGDIDLSDPRSFVEGVPHDYFAMLRREAPVSWQPRSDGTGPGFWCITRYQDIVSAEKQVPLFSSRTNISPMPAPETSVATQLDHNLILSDPPRHGFLRRLIMTGFSPKAIQKIEAQMRVYARQAVDSVIERGECDFVDVAAYLPVEVVSDILGVAPYDRPRLFEWANLMFGTQDSELSSPTRNLIGAMEMFTYARQLGAKKRAHPVDDIFSTIAVAQENGQQLSDTDLGSLFLLMATAGNETTRTQAIHGIHLLMEHRDVMEQLRAKPDLMPNAVEEMLRLTTPAMGFMRKLTDDTVFEGQPMKAGDKVMLWYVSGNRDESVFPEAGRFNITRSNARDHLSFGARGAPHMCLGAMLARTELRIVLSEVIERIPDIALAGRIERQTSNFTNGVKRMPVRFTPGRSSEQPPVNRLYQSHAAAKATTAAPPPQKAAPRPEVETTESGDNDMPIKLIPLATATLKLGTPTVMPEGPRGTRLIVEVASATWEGERLRAKQLKGAAGDWALVAPDGTLSIDVRATLETHDGALIFLNYQGRSDYTKAGAAPLVIAPLFETGDPRYAWLNKVQAIGRGTALDMETLVYEIYEVM
ncbi:MAG: Cytochrome [Hydrocarboniphaga sp.]|uniref:DUF3237 family protein n=1 Tax=Hydrocarboniphaga sp. TaxID=2033016 RepID=UPI00261181A8|nr:DUF3237 family protein [Hydrocarboniphaga sp.]MDB5969889.1 Cytochrome [Hydrocarboniphaga sp.]